MKKVILRLRQYGPRPALARLRIRSGLFAQFGSRSVISPPFIVAARHRIAVGQDVVFESGARLQVADTNWFGDRDPMLTIGDRVHFGQRAHIACIGRIDVEDDVLASDNVFIGDTYHEYRDVQKPIRYQGNVAPRPVRIGRGAFLGIFSVILPGVTVGPGAYVGAGAVVTKDIPPNCVAVGNPARIVRFWDPAAGEWVGGSPT